MKNEELQIVKLMDQIDKEDVMQELKDGLYDQSLEQSLLDIQDEVEDKAAIERIKSRTLSLLQEGHMHTQQSAKRRFLGRHARLLAAAAAAILLLCAVVFTMPDVQAGLKKVLRFLPGIGVVQEGEATQETYVLEKPYVQAIGEGTLTIDGIVLQAEGSIINLRGREVPEVEQFQAEIGDRIYTFRSFMRSASGDWFGSYGVTTDAIAPVANEITLYVDGRTIGPLKLVTAKTASDLERLGASELQQGIRVTAFPTDLGDGLVRIQLNAQSQAADRIVHSYGVSPIGEEDIGLYVEDDNGTKAIIQQDNDLSYPSDFRFRETEEGMKTYTVVIPYLKVSDRNAASAGEVVIPVPQVGSSHEVDVSTEIDGFPVAFTRIERTIASGVSVDVDTDFDLAKPRTLNYFQIRTADSPFPESFSWEDHEQGGMKTLYLAINPDQTELRFSLVEPHYIIKGPWRLPVTVE
ncbi:hypothetical protein PAECIP111893_04777 [Paenibacillus plantiphilus]|uniref:DUF4179 domain-containing protein n=1 Tax=Paenibacillus plantiphilus TaxID=2905650 RepID=A0ABM9CR25_9BACL|nr:hypothetical protein [Paenibacillus plantiphilus]CAH1221799.1 hypothetical protein PAECIP111893_04777 [Paenibacillus plantiphilus]